MKPRIRLDDPHIRAVWEASVACGREVAAWPAWKRSEDVGPTRLPLPPKPPRVPRDDD